MSPSLLSLLVASGCGSGVDVRVAADLTLDIEAKNASVSSVLECLSERAGFKMVIEPGLATRQTVTISLSRRTPTQAVVGVLDGLRLNYAYTSDLTGSRVLILLISGRSEPVPVTPVTSSGPTAGRPGPGREQQIAPPEPEWVPSNEPSSDRLPLITPSLLFPPGPAPLYPQAYPLSPLSLRDARRIHTASPNPN